MLCVIWKEAEPAHAGDFVYRGMSFCARHFHKARDRHFNSTGWSHMDDVVRHILAEEEL